MTARVHHRRTSPSSSKSITLALLKRGGRGLRIPLRTRTPSSEFFLVALQANKSENGNEKRTRNNGQDDDPRWPRESAQSLIPSRTMRHVEQSLESISVLSPRSRPSSAIQRLDETCRLRRRPPSITTPFFFSATQTVYVRTRNSTVPRVPIPHAARKYRPEPMRGPNLKCRRVGGLGARGKTARQVFFRGSEEGSRRQWLGRAGLRMRGCGAAGRVGLDLGLIERARSSLIGVRRCGRAWLSAGGGLWGDGQ